MFVLAQAGSSMRCSRTLRLRNRRIRGNYLWLKALTSSMHTALGTWAFLQQVSECKGIINMVDGASQQKVLSNGCLMLDRLEE